MNTKLTEEDKEWIENAYQKGFTSLQLKRKLEKAHYTEERIESFIQYLEHITKENEQHLQKKKQLENDEEFKKSVQQYFTEQKKEMSWGERRAVKKFLKNVEKYMKAWKIIIEQFKKEIERINELFKGDKTKVARETEYAKQEFIDRIIDSKIILDVEDPITGLEATKENLSNNDTDTLIQLGEQGITHMGEIINGRID